MPSMPWKQSFFLSVCQMLSLHTLEGITSQHFDWSKLHDDARKTHKVMSSLHTVQKSHATLRTFQMADETSRTLQIVQWSQDTNN